MGDQELEELRRENDDLRHQGGKLVAEQLEKTIAVEKQLAHERAAGAATWRELNDAVKRAKQAEEDLAGVSKALDNAVRQRAELRDELVRRKSRPKLRTDETADMTRRPWFGWMTDVPNEGVVVVNALDEADALTQVRELFNADDVPEGDEPSECNVRPVNATDVEDLLPEG